MSDATSQTPPDPGSGPGPDGRDLPDAAGGDETAGGPDLATGSQPEPRPRVGASSGDEEVATAEGEPPSREQAAAEDDGEVVVVPLRDPQRRTQSLELAVEAVREGECVVLPTDTVYGIGANALDPLAVQRLLDAKDRGRDMPPPVLIGDAAVLAALCDRVPAGASDLAQAFWPGALTLVLRAQESLSMDLGETNGTIAVRVPDDDDTRELLRRTGPLAVSSANRSGRPAATTVDEAVGQLGTRVAVYLDGGPSRVGTASTIVDFAATDTGKVLRQGAIELTALQEVAPEVEGLPELADHEEPVPTDHQEVDAPAPPPHEGDASTSQGTPDRTPSGDDRSADETPLPDASSTHRDAGPTES